MSKYHTCNAEYINAVSHLTWHFLLRLSSQLRNDIIYLLCMYLLYRPVRGLQNISVILTQLEKIAGIFCIKSRRRYRSRSLGPIYIQREYLINVRYG